MKDACRSVSPIISPLKSGVNIKDQGAVRQIPFNENVSSRRRRVKSPSYHHEGVEEEPGYDHPHGSSHIFKATTPSSRRVKAAYMFGMQPRMRKAPGYGKKIRHRRQRFNRKIHKMESHLLPFRLSDVPKNITRLTTEEALQNHVVVDGGSTGNGRIAEHGTQTLVIDGKEKPVTCLSIRDGDLHVVNNHIDQHDKGIICSPSRGKTIQPSPPFIVIPRRFALETTGLHRKAEQSIFMKSLQEIIRVHRRGHTRGKHCSIMIGPLDKYCTFGTRPRRNAPGVSSYTYHASEAGFEHYNNLVNYVSLVERCIKAYCHPKDLNFIRRSKELIDFPTMTKTGGNGNETSPEFYSNVAAMLNGYLSCHIDADYFQCVVTAHTPRHYIMNDNILCYFCFERLGLVIPMRPGDLIVFNPREPHHVSSRCNDVDNVYVVSLYLKSANVGLNDNSINLSPNETSLSNAFSRGSVDR